jgi:hypothetical protein
MKSSCRSGVLIHQHVRAAVEQALQEELAAVLGVELYERSEVAHAVRYVLGNYRHHTLETLPAHRDDPCSSARYLKSAPLEDAPVVSPRTWVLRVGWDDSVP